MPLAEGIVLNKYILVNVNIKGTLGSGFDWGFLSTRPENMRIFKGPPETCSAHPWDAMILRDCTSNTDTLSSIESMSSRKWDILCMKMCEDYDCKAPPNYLSCAVLLVLTDFKTPGLWSL